MSKTAQDSQLIVEDVVTALTGVGPTAEENTERDLGSQMERAAEEFDKRTASAFCRALLDSLCEDPGNLRQLEALIILGLAHPDVLGQNRISLAVEGRRLAVLLERGGEGERARGVLELLANHMPEERTIDHELAGMLRRSGNTDELVERYLTRAERAVQEGSIQEAIPWLQEILLLDRTRRDVARMIRDLRYQEAERAARSKRRNRILLVVLLMSACVAAVVARDLKIRKAYDALPAAQQNDAKSLSVRQGGIDNLLNTHGFWTASKSAKAERERLVERQTELRLQEEQRQKLERSRQSRQLEAAESARAQGLLQTEKAEYKAALESFKSALAEAPEGWEHTERVTADITALEAWMEGQE